MNNCINFLWLIFVAGMMPSCKSQNADTVKDDITVDAVVIPVTVTHPMHGSISQIVNLNATATFLLKTFVKSNVIGYLETSGVKLGDYVSKGQTLFTIKTKEAVALGTTISRLDSSLHFEGVIKINSPISGYVSLLSYTKGNYVQDGEQLAAITDQSSFVFLLDLPYELKPYLPQNKKLLLYLPDSTTLQGYVQSALPVVDSVAQTQRYILKVNTGRLIPENLIAKVLLVKQQITNATLLPRAAILSNEEQTGFWIMKMLNDSVAVKTMITKGIENDNSIQVVSPPLYDSDKILLSGNYGLSDTAKVRIEHVEN
jgi:multidrug efflux pump subunit AcrA (membrane-fusion protein)